ncbi:PSA3 protein, partial [Spelaeornis formosus]|nr:PSA3 protein [Elachura formosa]
SRRYDSRTTIFSPEGRLYQVEYALESISHAGTVYPPPHRAGIVLAAEKKVTSKLLEKDKGSSEKLFLVNGNVITGVAGYNADANSLVSYARNAAQTHLAAYDEDMPVEQLVQKLCDLKQGYTQFGGLRPFGVSFLFAGHDPHHAFQLYASDPSGNYSGWKATCIGANNSTAQSLLRQDFRDDIGLDEAIGLALKVLSKTMDSTSLDSEKLELATLTVDEATGLPFAKIFKPHEIDAALEK